MSCDTNISTYCKSSPNTIGASSSLSLRDICPEECKASCTSATMQSGSPVHNCLTQKAANLQRAAEQLNYDKNSTMPGVCLAAQEFYKCLPSACCGLSPQLDYVYSSSSPQGSILRTLQCAKVAPIAFPCKAPSPVTDNKTECNFCGDGKLLPDAIAKFPHREQYKMECSDAREYFSRVKHCQDDHMKRKFKYWCCTRPSFLYDSSKCSSSGNDCYADGRG